jgi:AcrR family transcriptional regulator
MQREEKSEKSRRQVLDAALQLFSHQGYRATTMREIAEGARVSTGNVYHHFPDKEAIFNSLLDELWDVAETRRFPFRRALIAGQFPDNIESLGFAARESVKEFRLYFALIYVDLTKRYAELIGRNGGLDEIAKRLRPGVSPISALILVTRIFFNYFTIEILFNVPEPFGKNTNQAVAEIADILRNGMME